MGQLLAPRAFGSKKCVVLAFVVSEPDIRTTGHFFLFDQVKPQRTSGSLRGTFLLGVG